MFRKVQGYWRDFGERVSHPGARVIVRNWLLVSLLLSFLGVWTIIEVDITMALFVPIHIRGMPDRQGRYIYLFRMPEDKRSVFAVKVQENIRVKTNPVAGVAAVIRKIAEKVKETMQSVR